jgi:hypothetical protein
MTTRTTRKPRLRLEPLEDRWVPVAPVNSLPGAQVTVVDFPLVFSAATGNPVSVADPDGPGPFEIELSIRDVATGNAIAGTVSVASTTGLTATGNGTVDLTLVGSLADANAALTQITYTPAAGYTGTARLVLESDDQVVGGLADTDFVLITVSPPALTPSVTTATTGEDTQTTSGLVISRNPASGPEVTHFKITGISNGTLFQNNGTTPIANDSFITFAQGSAGLRFTPAANLFGTGSFNVQASVNNTNAGLGGSTVAATITVNPVADTPAATDAATTQGVQTTSGLVISRNPADGSEVTHFKLTGIQNGTLFQNNGTTPIANDSFITFAQGSAGLKFTPAAGFSGTGSFGLQASVNNTNAGLGGALETALITVVADPPPAVTINQAAAQADPTAASPITFDVVFSEPVTGFTGADINFAGSTIAGLVANVSGSGANYTVTVTGMATPGFVVVSILVGAAQDAAGNGNTASTSTDNTVSFQLSSISGSVFDDLDGDGVAAADPGQGGVTVQLIRDANNDGLNNDAVFATATTAAGTGGYSFANLAPGRYFVQQVTSAGAIQTFGPAFYTVVAASGTDVPDQDFGNFTLISISGEVFDDANGDGVRDGGEPGVSGVSVELDIGADGTTDATTATDGTGGYNFADLGPGSYRIRVIVPSGETQTSSDPADVIATSGQDVTNADFGITGDETAPPPPAKVDLFAVGSGPGIEATVEVFNADGTPRFSLRPFRGFTGGVAVATGDVTGDGIDDIAAAAGPGAGPHVKVFDGATGAEIRSFFAYAPDFTGGVFVGLGDVTGDGLADIVTGVGVGGAPHVKVLDGQTLATVHSFFAFDPEFRGGVTVRAGDVDGDGFADIVTGVGPGGAPHIKAFSGVDLALLQSFFAGDADDRTGVFVGVANLSGDSRAELVAGLNGRVKVFGNVEIENPYIEQENLVSFDAAQTSVAAIRLDDGITAVLVGAAPASGAGPHVKIVDSTSNTIRQSFFVFDPAFIGGVFVG